ncbi:GNAT family N-acetyltransferase [Brevibacillus centrosporus]|uniref:GNAT family N-acetyltransferase n=1 Tax=Brevibacillus centrosporus TaxID=54910 RepID=UPI001167173E|nr:GNAT family N-acetyltransferase [Brevibacillus centrosporus]MEC2129141.1 GNAT family N-acetyltransferase [Brevibacillus centrosporus]GED29372.1 hypothetical protein BCE02nite_05130 [Brevibacillus centrosporus]
MKSSRNVRRYDQGALQEVPWEQMKDGAYVKAYLSACLIDGAGRYVKNVRTKMEALAVDDIVLPVTINETEYENSYVCSPYTHYITYAREELRMLRMPMLEWILERVLKGLGWLLKISRVNQIAILNNWLLSTNLYHDLSPEQISALTQFCTHEFLQHVIAFRSVSAKLHPAMYEGMRKAGYLMVPSRCIYLFHPDWPALGGWRVRNTLKRDQRMLQNSGYRVVPHEELHEALVGRIIDLYNALYLDKYSHQNPQFTHDFIRLALKKRTLTLIGLEKDGQLDGILGYFERNGVMTTPLFGYDTTLPKEAGLYRMLSSLLVQEARKKELLLHQSAGVGAFKADRGAVGEVEYTAVYVRHLPLSRRIVWRVLSWILLRFGVPLIQKYQL